MNPAADGNKEEVEDVKVGDKEETGSIGVASDVDIDEMEVALFERNGELGNGRNGNVLKSSFSSV